MFPYLIFDLDGTLVDSYDGITESLNRALDRMGLPRRSVHEVRPKVGLGLETLIRGMVGEDRVEEGVRLFRRHYSRICASRTRLLPGVSSTLAALHRKKIRMAVATNKPTPFTERILTSLSIRAYFDYLIGPDLVTHPKPHPEMIFRVLRHFPCARWEVILVGDMSVDVETARTSGIPVAVLPTGSQTRQQLEKAGPDLILDRFADLPPVLAKFWMARARGGEKPMTVEMPVR